MKKEFTNPIISIKEFADEHVVIASATTPELPKTSNELAQEALAGKNADFITTIKWTL